MSERNQLRYYERVFCLMRGVYLEMVLLFTLFANLDQLFQNTSVKAM